MQNECGYSFEQKLDYIPTRPKQQRLSELSESELADKIKENPQWGQMVCRCEQVTEAEIVEACHSPIPITNTDMIKRRLRPGMGRCQGGFLSSESYENSIPRTANNLRENYEVWKKFANCHGANKRAHRRNLLAENNYDGGKIMVEEMIKNYAIDVAVIGGGPQD